MSSVHPLRSEIQCPPKQSCSSSRTTPVRVPEFPCVLVNDRYLNRARERSDITLILCSALLQGHGGDPLSIIPVRCWCGLRRLLPVTSSGMVQDSVFWIERHPWSRLGISLSRSVPLRPPHMINQVLTREFLFLFCR